MDILLENLGVSICPVYFKAIKDPGFLGSQIIFPELLISEVANNTYSRKSDFQDSFPLYFI